jgi:sec-independent protein translocase protein TatB
MFDVGFWELAVIFVVGLLVLGPERLPAVAAQVGRWAGRARSMARVLTTQIQDEINAADPRRIMDAPRSPPAASAGTWNRPGVDELKATPAPPADSAAGDLPPGSVPPDADGR